MTDAEFLELRRRDLEASVDYFRSHNKCHRERWVVREFLNNLGIVFSESDLRSAQDDPPDVLFVDSKFEVKEIMNSDRRRHAEYKAALDRARAATKASELIEHYTPRDITLIEVAELIHVEAEKFAGHYGPTTCESLDLLFYVNLNDVMGMSEVPYPDLAPLRRLPWRSVSFVMGQRSCVLVVRPNGPAILRNAVGCVKHRPHEGPSASADE